MYPRHLPVCPLETIVVADAIVEPNEYVSKLSFTRIACY